MTIKKLLTLCKGKRLKTVVEKIYNEAKAKGFEIYIYPDMTNVIFDVEIKEDYNDDVFSYFEKEFYVKGEDDGWVDSQLDKNFAKLLKGWKWENIKLTDGNILIVDKDEDLDIVSFMILNLDNLHSGAIEMRMMFPQNFYETTL